MQEAQATLAPTKTIGCIIGTHFQSNQQNTQKENYFSQKYTTNAILHNKLLNQTL